MGQLKQSRAAQSFFGGMALFFLIFSNPGVIPSAGRNRASDMEFLKRDAERVAGDFNRAIARHENGQIRQRGHS